MPTATLNETAELRGKLAAIEPPLPGPLLLPASVERESASRHFVRFNSQSSTPETVKLGESSSRARTAFWIQNFTISHFLRVNRRHSA